MLITSIIYLLDIFQHAWIWALCSCAVFLCRSSNIQAWIPAFLSLWKTLGFHGDLNPFQAWTCLYVCTSVDVDNSCTFLYHAFLCHLFTVFYHTWSWCLKITFELGLGDCSVRQRVGSVSNTEFEFHVMNHVSYTQCHAFFKLPFQPVLSVNIRTLLSVLSNDAFLSPPVLCWKGQRYSAQCHNKRFCSCRCLWQVSIREDAVWHLSWTSDKEVCGSPEECTRWGELLKSAIVHYPLV